MLVKDIPRCNNLVTDASKSGNTACCLRVATWGISLSDGKTWDSCLSCMTKRLAVLGTDIDTASVVFYLKK